MPRKPRDQPPPAPPMAMSESDDDAPEEVSGSLSRHGEASRQKEVQAAEKRKKDALREKRRQKQELFRMQKERKLQDLSKRKLPQDVLDAVSNKFVSTQEAKKSSTAMNRSEQEKDDNSDNETEQDDGLGDDLSDTSFIPLDNLGTNSLHLQTHDDLVRKAVESGYAARGFKMNQFYGKNVPRLTTKQRQARISKRSAFLKSSRRQV